MSRADEIRSAYRGLGKTAGFYDGMMTCSTALGTLVSRAVWKIGPKENDEYIARALEGVPEGFDGAMLEVPIGTGVLTMPLYKTLPDAQVTCLDYSADMMQAARTRARELGVENVGFVQGDVGNLPFEDESFDIVLSLNGFHAFPDKEAAFAETWRVLRPGGTFCGCFYVRGEVARTDRIVRRIYVPKGFFTPPFETLSSLRARLEGLYSSASVEAIRGMGCFTCVK